jgi:DNA-directed RNA polymerase subunit beta'
MNRNFKILERFKESIRITQFNAIRISIASPEQIKLLSYGEVKKIETINYRTFRPEKDGLFCPRIFGPTQDWTCICGKYKRMKHRGIVCEKCGVEVIEARVRRERMGHIDLATPVVHIWYLRETPSYLSLILSMTIKDLERVIYFEAYIVVSQGKSAYPIKTVLNGNEYLEYVNAHPEDYSFMAEMGANPIKTILERMDLSLEIALLRVAHDKANSTLIKVKLMRRIKILTQLMNAKIRPEWMILKTLPVLPPDLRPLVPLDGGRFASSDLNELYRRVINRNLRLKRLMEIQAPSVIIKNEQRILQESVDALIDNSRKAQPIRVNKRPLKSLSEMLRGKQGRFRQNLLGKRVDYSARSVIIVDPTLKIDQCGLPKLMVLELFKSHILCQLIKRGIATNIRIAKKILENPTDVVWEILEDITVDYPVLLNRAPTLHRLGIQSFYPKLIESKAITIHPLVTVAFGADFDGDQMGVYIPLSKNAILEAKKLMLSSINLLSPQNGRPAMMPHQEMVLGIYYLTKIRLHVLGSGLYFSSFDEVLTAYECSAIHIHSRIYVLDSFGKLIDTTTGRVIFYYSLPKNYEFEKINKIFNKTDLVKLVEEVYFSFGSEKTVIMLDKIKELGFKYATKSGFTFAYDYLINPKNRNIIIDKAENDAGIIEKSFQKGIVTAKERYNKLLQIWDKASAMLSSNMLEDLESWDQEAYLNESGQNQQVDDIHYYNSDSMKEFNFLFACLDSKSRGSTEQIKQIIAMRGLMSKPSGEIIEHPVKSNFKLGLTIFEYFTSTHGARKGQADTALKTANAGYLTRRLVDVAQDIIVTMHDCGSNESLNFENLTDNGDIVINLMDRIYGKVLAEDIINSLTKDIILKKGTLLNKSDISKIKGLLLHNVKVRSTTKCYAKHGVCALCYGMDLSKNNLVMIGSAVGIIAAQSIGEPGTQLTLRTFHIGGTASFNDRSSYAAKDVGVIVLSNVDFVENQFKQNIVISRKGILQIIGSNGSEIQKHYIAYGSILHVLEGQIVKKDDKLFEWDTSNTLIINEQEGRIEFIDIINNVTVQNTYDEVTDKTTIIVIDQKNDKFQPAISVIDTNNPEVILKQYILQVGAIIVVSQDDVVMVGDILAKIPLESAKSKDITTGGLPKIAEFFEARMVKDPCILSEIDGEIAIGSIVRGMRKISVVNNEKSIDYLIPKNKQLMVSNGDFVVKGDQITAGNPILQDLLKIRGINYLQMYLVNQLQLIYKGQGQSISDRHFELIIKQMTRKVKITDPGDTTFLIGDKVDRIHLENINFSLQNENRKKAQYTNELMGITLSSLGTESFFAAASFQETTRILAEAAVNGQVDYLRGPKENVIIGREIPAGTGIESFKKIILGV